MYINTIKFVNTLHQLIYKRFRPTCFGVHGVSNCQLKARSDDIPILLFVSFITIIFIPTTLFSQE